MKTTITTLLLLITFTINAQQISFKATPMLSKSKEISIGNESYKVNYLTSYKAGIYFQKQLSFNFSFEPGIVISQKGFNSSFEYKNIEYPDYDVNATFNHSMMYLEVPLNFKFQTGLLDIKLQDYFITSYYGFRIHAYAGPYIAYLLSGTCKETTGTTVEALSRSDIPFRPGKLGSDWNKYDLGFNVGIGFTYGSTEVSVEYSKSFSSIYKKGEILNKYLGLKMGLYFGPR